MIEKHVRVAESDPSHIPQEQQWIPGPPSSYQLPGSFLSSFFHLSHCISQQVMMNPAFIHFLS